MKYLIMHRSTFILLFLFSISFQVLVAQEAAVNQARAYLKEKKIKEAEGLINQAIANAKTANEAATWDVAGKIQLAKAEQQLENAYLKKQYDTIAIYDGVLNMTRYFLKCDSLAQTLEKKQKVNRFRKTNLRSILAERKNLLNGGVFFYNKALNKQVPLTKPLEFFHTYITMANSDMLDSEHINGKDSVFTQVAYYATTIVAEMGNYNAVKEYAAYAQYSKPNGKYALSYLAEAYQKLGDYDQQLATLKLGIERYPESDTFFANLIDFYSEHKRYKEAMTFTDELLKKEPQNFFYHYVKGFLLQSTERYKEALISYKEAIRINANYAEAYSNIGLIYCLLADKLQDAQDNYEPYQDDYKSYYTKAQGYYENARKLKPEQKSLWLNGLYRVYYNLHIGEKFKEIESLM